MLIFIHIQRCYPSFHASWSSCGQFRQCSTFSSYSSIYFIATHLWKLPQLDWPFWPWNEASKHHQIMALSRLEKIFMEARHYHSMHRSVRFDGFCLHWYLETWLKPRLPSKQSKGILSWRLSQLQWYPVQNKTRQSICPQLLENCRYNHPWEAIACWRENRPFQYTRVQSLIPCLSCASPSWPERVCGD